MHYIRNTKEQGTKYSVEITSENVLLACRNGRKEV